MQVAQYTSSILLVISALISGLIALFMWTKQTLKGARTLALLMFGLTIWVSAYEMMWSSSALDAKVVWLNLTYFGELTAPIIFLAFVMKITGHDRWLTKRNILLLFIEPVLTFFVIWTKQLNYLFSFSYKMTYVNSLPELSWTNGPWFGVSTSYSYALIIVAIMILARAFIQAGPYARTQFGVILLGCLLPQGFTIYTLYISNSLNNIDITPIPFAVSGVFFAVALLKFGLQDILPIARNILIEKITDGVLVLDMSGRILDINPAAQKNIADQDNVRGRDVRAVYPEWNDLIDRLLKEKDLHFEIRSKMDVSIFYDLVVTPLMDKHGRDNGRLITFRDISKQKKAEANLEKMNARLRTQVRKISILRDELREQATRDPLTNLFNRRYLTETLERELSLAKRKEYSVSIIMMDIDRFKHVNDTYGHKTGDQVLRVLGKIIRTNVRSSDIPCRFGGEEFVIVMPETTVEIAEQRANQICEKFRSTKFFDEEEPLVSTLSVGVAAFPDHGDDLESILNSADQAMYLAKTVRDTVVIYREKSSQE